MAAAHAVDIPQVKMDMKRSRDGSGPSEMKTLVGLTLCSIVTSIITSIITAVVAVNVLGVNTAGFSSTAATNLNEISQTMQVSTASDGVQVVTVQGRLVIMSTPESQRRRRLSEVEDFGSGDPGSGPPSSSHVMTFVDQDGNVRTTFDDEGQMDMYDTDGHQRMSLGTRMNQTTGDRPPLMQLFDEDGIARCSMDANHQDGYGGSGMVVSDHDGKVRLRTITRGSNDVRMDFLDGFNKTRVEISSAGMGVADRNGQPRSFLGASSGLSLLDANGTYRFSADTTNENFTRVSVLDHEGHERIRLSGSTGEMRMYDNEGQDRFFIDEEGSVRLMDGATEAFTLSRFGMQGVDPYGNITLSFDRVRGSLETAGAVLQDEKISVDEIRESYASFCSQETFAFEAARESCQHDTQDLFDHFGITPPVSQTALSSESVFTTLSADGFDPEALGLGQPPPSFGSATPGGTATPPWEVPPWEQDPGRWTHDQPEGTEPPSSTDGFGHPPDGFGGLSGFGGTSNFGGMSGFGR